MEPNRAVGRHHRFRFFMVLAVLDAVAIANVLRPIAAVAEDCCTPEATVRIAAAAGFIEIAGIKLGTPAKQAVEVLKAHRPSLSIEPPAILRVDVLPGIDFVTGLSAGTLDSGRPGNSNLLEEIQVSLTPPPSEPAAWGISYQAIYPPDARPTLASTLAQLRKAYGPESGTTSVGRIAEHIQALFGVEQLDAYWVFDAVGERLPEKEAGEFYRSCAEYASGVKVILSDTSFLRGRGEWIEPRNQTNCGNNTLVIARWDPSEPSMGEPKGFVKNLKIEAANGLLHRSAYEATYAMEIRATRGGAK